MGGQRYWDGQQWTDHFRPAARLAVPPPLPPPPPRSRHLWWALSPAYTFGVISFIPALHAAMKLKRRDLWLWAAGLIAGSVAVWGIAGSDTSESASGSSSLMGIFVLVLMVVGTIHAFRVRDEVFGAPPAVAVGPGPVAAEDDPAVAHSRAARNRRIESSALAKDDPGVARDLMIGRPDLGQRSYDDGGLVDVNHVPESVLVSHLGFSAAQPRATIEARDTIDGFEGADDLCHLAGIAPRTVDAVRDRILTL